MSSGYWFPWSSIVFVLGPLFGALAFVLWLHQTKQLTTVNGPKGYPFVGIGLSLPQNAPDIFRRWAQEYGDIFKVRVGWYNWVIVNSPEAAKEIFDKQSAHTSSKVPLPYGHDLVSGGMRMFTMSYGARWREYRTIVHKLLSIRMTLTFIPSQAYEVKQLLYDLATSNTNETDFYSHIRRMSISIVSTSALGRRIDSKDHEDIKRAGESSKLLGRISRAGAFIEDELPFLLYLPRWAQPSYKKAQEYAKILLNAKIHVWNRLKDEVESGHAPSSFGKELAESEYRLHGLTEEDAAWIAGGLVEAGSETTSVTLLNLILYLAANPQVQDQAHKEIQRVVGDSRLPSFSDVPALPYIRACIKEILRLCPVPTFGIKHFADRDITYKEHLIPKGTVLLLNITSIHYDPKLWRDPLAFKPERYLHMPLSSAEYAATPDPYKRDHFTFGAGRRICPGSRLAENTLYIALANLIWAFEIRPPLAIVANGSQKEEAMDLSDDAFDTRAAFRPPKPFRVRFVPRSRGREDIVVEQWKEAKKEGYVLRGTNINAGDDPDVVVVD